MKICEINGQAGERRPFNIMEQSKPLTKLVRPTYGIPEWSSRAEEEYLCEDVGCSPARKEQRNDLRCSRAMRRDRRGEVLFTGERINLPLITRPAWERMWPISTSGS